MMQSSAVPTTGKRPAPAQKHCRDAPKRPASVTKFFAALLRSDTHIAVRPAAELQAYLGTSKAPKASDWANLCRHLADNRLVAVLPGHARRIGYPPNSMTETSKLADPAFFVAGRIICGISGQVPGQIRLRFSTGVIALRRNSVHLLAGVNDLACSEGLETRRDIRSNLISITTLAEVNGVRVLSASITPARRFPRRPVVEPARRISELNAWHKSWAARTGATYVGYDDVRALSDCGMRPNLSSEGAQLTGAGYDGSRTSVLPRQPSDRSKAFRASHRRNLKDVPTGVSDGK